jgi:hypothetical protein
MRWFFQRCGIDLNDGLAMLPALFGSGSLAGRLAGTHRYHSGANLGTVVGCFPPPSGWRAWLQASS